MHLTTYTDYSLRVLMRLALTPDRLITIAEIATAYGISEHHLMKVVHQLGVAGYIETHRGRGGGMRLARNAADITLGEVVRCMEPHLGLVACFRQGETCSISTACALSPILGEALEAFLAVLDHRSVADLISGPRQLRGLLKIGPPAQSAPPDRH